MSPYTGMFKRKYGILTGKNWINTISPEDKQVFISIGLQHADHGRLGGLAHSKSHMRKIAKRGAIMTNILKQWRKSVMLETLRLENDQL